MKRLRTPNTSKMIVSMVMPLFTELMIIGYLLIGAQKRLFTNIVNYNAFYLLIAIMVASGLGIIVMFSKKPIWGYINEEGVGYCGVKKRYHMFSLNEVTSFDVVEARDRKQYLIISKQDIPEEYKSDPMRIAQPNLAFVVEWNTEVEGLIKQHLSDVRL